jgi:hypothetical protein
MSLLTVAVEAGVDLDVVAVAVDEVMLHLAPRAPYCIGGDRSRHGHLIGTAGLDEGNLNNIDSIYSF